MTHRIRERGASFAEILVALAILSLALLTMITVFVKNLSLAGKAEEITVATEIGRRQIENIRLIKKDEIPVPTTFTGASVTADGFPPEPYPAQILDEKRYKLEVRTSESGDLTLVETTVVWERGRITLAALVRP